MNSLFTDHLLTCIIAVPFLGMAVLAFVRNEHWIRRIALAFTLLTFGLFLILWSDFKPDAVTGKVADKLALRLTAALEEPYMIGSETLQCAASIGLALYPENARTLTGLLREADQAMYRAKARSRDEADTGGTGLLEKAI